MDFSFNAIQHTLSLIIYAYLIAQSYRLLRDIRKYQLLHEGILQKIRPLCYEFTGLLVLKLAVTAHNLAAVSLHYPSDSTAYSVGYRAGYYTGYWAKSFSQNIALMFAVGFIWLLATVFKSAVRMKQEQDLTI